jgi:hypothetical protein
VVAGKQFAQVADVAGVHVGLLGHGVGIDELPVKLGVELLPVGHEHEGPCTRKPTQHFLREPQHRQALA